MNLPVNRVLQLIVGVMVLGFTTLALTGGGPIDDILDQIEQEIDEEATSNPPVKVDSKRKLAGIAKLSMDRAAECDSVRAHTYPDLSGTRIGSDPNCRLGLPGEGISRDYTSPVDPTGPGDDVEGVDSRIRFEIKEDMVFKTGAKVGEGLPADPGVWYGSSDSEGYFGLSGVSDSKYSETITNNCNPPGPNKYQTARDSIREYGYLLTFSIDGSGRYTSSGSNKLITETDQYGNTGGAYCISRTLEDNLQPISAVGNVLNNNGEDFTEVKLCKGDKGYIQVNKKKPFKDAETEDTGENLGDTPLFGYIQITESSGSCLIDDP